jgi:hypothetical protein
MTLYARWDDIEARVRDAVEAVLTDHDPAEGLITQSQIEWAQETAERVWQTVDLHLDGYTTADVAAETTA